MPNAQQPLDAPELPPIKPSAIPPSFWWQMIVGTLLLFFLPLLYWDFYSIVLGGLNALLLLELFGQRNNLSKELRLVRPLGLLGILLVAVGLFFQLLLASFPFLLRFGALLVLIVFHLFSSTFPLKADASRSTRIRQIAGLLVAVFYFMLLTCSFEDYFLYYLYFLLLAITAVILLLFSVPLLRKKKDVSKVGDRLFFARLPQLLFIIVALIQLLIFNRIFY